MMTGRHKYLLLLESECYLESKNQTTKAIEKGDLFKMCPEAAIDNFLTKRRVLQKLFCNVAVLHLRSAFLACFSRF